MKPLVLIGFADAFAAIESAWCLASDGFEVCAFTRSGTRPALAHSRFVRVVPITAPEVDACQSIADLTALIDDLKPAAVLPLDDHAVWVCDRSFQLGLDAPDGSGQSGKVVIAGPTGQLATLALDKREQLKLAATAGFAVPPSHDAAGDSPLGTGPWMVKPAMAVELRSGRLHRLVGRVATTPAQVREIAAAMGGPALAQPLIKGTGEGVFGLATSRGITAWSAHRRIRMVNPRGSGSSACRSIPLADDLVEPVRDFLTAAGWRGMFMVEMLRDSEGRPWFMELNGRAWGSMALALRRGYEYPSWTVRAALDPAFEPPLSVTLAQSAPDVTIRHLGREIVHVGMVLARGGAPRLKTIRDVLTVRRGERWYNWRRDEPRVFVADTWFSLRGHLSRKKGR